MSSDLTTPATRQRLATERERVISTLSEQFAQGDLEVEDFERRLDELHRCTSLAELATHAQGLPSTAPPPSAPTALVPMDQAPKHKQVLAIFGSTARKGTWAVPRKLNVTATFGNIELDFRDARLPAGLVEVEAHAVFGNIELVVPPHLAVETEGAGIFGNFEHRERAPATPDPEAPFLRVKGAAVFGNIEVSTKLPRTTTRKP